MGKLLFMIRKEFLQIRRDRAMLRIIFAVPLAQLLVLGFAANLDLENVTVAILDQDRTAQSRQLSEAVLQSQPFVPGPTVANRQELQQALVMGRAEATLWIPRGYARDLAAGLPSPVGLSINGTNSASGGKAGSYLARIIQEQGRLQAEAAGAPAAATAPPLRAHTRFLYNPELVSRYFMVPGILVILVTVISALLTSMAVVREKEIGTLEQLLVTPLRTGHLIAGKIIPFAILSYATLALATMEAVLVFHVPIAGSLGLLAVAMAAYLLVTLGGGLLASTVSATQQQAMFTAWFFLIFGILMSGFFYPIANMPHWAQLLTLLNPMRYIMAIVRGILLKGAGLADIGPDLLRLLAIGLATFTVAVARFQKRTG